MKTLPAGLAAHLASGATTLCHCWKLTTRGGEAMGFTDHDRDLSFEGTLFEAASGFTATELDSNLGLSVDNLEASGALSSARLSETRLGAGDFDNAAIALWRVNWSDVSQRVLMMSGNLGEVTRSGALFQAELRGLAHALNQPRGRLYQHGCDAILGDTRCGVNLAAASFSCNAQVLSCVANRRINVGGADGFAAGFFAGGTARLASGPNQGREGQVKFHRVQGAAVSIELWQPLPLPAQPGDAITLRAGCDKQFATCRDKFSNALNFRGFPHMPGDDFVMSYALRYKKSKR
jgi:uncharacterized phage protein (TIGR02218 family)